MSKDFDTTLSDALDLAASAAQTAGPAAARSRGRKRTMNQRLALSAASLLVVAVGATTAFEAASGHGGGPQPASGNHSTSASATGGPTTDPTHSVISIPTTAGPTDSATGSSSSSVGSSPAGSSAPASTQPGVGDPQKVLTGAWLPASQMPFDSTFHWQAVTAGSQTAPPQPLTSTVFSLPSDSSLQALTMCADPSQLLSRTIGGQYAEFSATAGTGNNQAAQYVFFYKDATTAQQAYKWLQAQYSSSCLLNGTGAQVKKTASEGTTGATWLTLSGTSSLPDLPKYAREYFVLRGSTIAYVYVLSYTNTLSTTYDDASRLSAIDSHMCVYGGACG